jgi:hypothetical protein
MAGHADRPGSTRPHPAVRDTQAVVAVEKVTGAGPRVRFPGATGALAVDVVDYGGNCTSSISSSGGGSGGGQPASSLPSDPSQLASMRRRLSNSGSFSGKAAADEAGDSEERPRAMSATPGEDKYGLLYTDCAHVLLED